MLPTRCRTDRVPQGVLVTAGPTDTSSGFKGTYDERSRTSTHETTSVPFHCVEDMAHRSLGRKAEELVASDSERRIGRLESHRPSV